MRRLWLFSFTSRFQSFRSFPKQPLACIQSIWHIWHIPASLAHTTGRGTAPHPDALQHTLVSFNRTILLTHTSRSLQASFCPRTTLSFTIDLTSSRVHRHSSSLTQVALLVLCSRRLAYDLCLSSRLPSHALHLF